MKKAISLLLTLSMLFVLCACGQSSEITSAASMMEAGDYEEALATLTQLEADEEITAMIAECENAIAYNSAIAMVNEGKYTEAYDVFVAISDYKDVADYLAKYKTVEITIDNWEDFFEFRNHITWLQNDFGETNEYVSSDGLYIKENFEQNILMDKSDVKFEINVDIDYHSFFIDYDEQVFELGKKRNIKSAYETFNLTVSLDDGYLNTEDPYISHGHWLWTAPGSIIKGINDDSSTAFTVLNKSILRAEGTLTYYEP